MKRLWVLLSVIFILMVSVDAQAIDRNARMIDRVSLDVSNLDDADSIGGSILGETSLATAWREWAVVFGGGFGTISPLGEPDADYWNLALGLKLYLLPVTSVSGVGRYERYNVGSTDRIAKSATFSLKQRLLPAEVAVSPFAAGSITVRDRSTFTDDGTDRSFSEHLFNVGGGCEFAMNDDFSFVFEAYCQFANSNHDDNEDLDGWLSSVSMVYYWH